MFKFFHDWCQGEELVLAHVDVAAVIYECLGEVPIVLLLFRLILKNLDNNSKYPLNIPNINHSRNPQKPTTKKPKNNNIPLPLKLPPNPLLHILHNITSPHQLLRQPPRKHRFLIHNIRNKP